MATSTTSNLSPTSDLLIGEVFSNAARAVPDRVAAVLGRHSLTFGELESQSNQLARALESRGLGPGSRIALWSTTTLEAVPLFAATSKTGALLIPVSGLLGEDEATRIFVVCRPDLVITDAVRAVPTAAEVTTLEELAEAAASHPSSAYRADQLSGTHPHVAFFTSGSTGQPKGVVLSHATNWLRSHPGALLEPRGVMVCPYPLFHMGAWTIALQQWQARDAVVFLESADAEAIREAVDRHRATRLNCVPAVWRRIIELASAGRPGMLSSVRYADTGTSATPLELLADIERTLPQAHLRVFYGSTEAGTVTFLDHADIERKPGSCGAPAPGVRVRRAEDGELWVRSPVLFDGYLDDPDATAASRVDGWYRTGDLVEEDEDGYLSIVGRTGDLIRTGGEAVVPAEVEAVLSADPDVKEVAVVGLPDPTWGEVVCAVVVPADGRPWPTVESLREHCAGRLAAFKHPRRVCVVDQLSRTPATGQIQRRLLAARLAEES